MTILHILSPADRPCRAPELEQTFIAGIRDQLPSTSTGGLTTYGIGRTGLLKALDRASQLFSNATATHAVVVGVDTFLRQRVVDAYIEERRVLTAKNSNGFIPGEAACAVLVAPISEGGDSEFRIIGWGEGLETGSILCDQPLTGNVLTGAVRGALHRSGLKMADTHYW